MDASETLKKLALEIGFDLVGIAPLDAAPDLAFAREWVRAGRGGEMSYLANPKRDDPRFVLPSAQSIVCVGLIYNAPLPYSIEHGKAIPAKLEKEPSPTASRSPLSRKERAVTPFAFSHPLPRGEGGEQSEPGVGCWPDFSEPRGWISRYAWGRDYHELMRAKLERLRKGMETLASGVETRVYVDTGPIVERAFARLSGIGWVGKNTCLIHPQKGSWFFLGVILSNLALKPDSPAPDRCGSCTRCIEACPTEALTPYVMDASRCIAYLTIELKGAIPEAFRPVMGNNIFGCDICQDVCPWNSVSHQSSAIGHQQQQKGRSAATTGQSEFQPLDLEIAPAHETYEPPELQIAVAAGKAYKGPPDFNIKDRRPEAAATTQKPQFSHRTSSVWRPDPTRVSLFNPPLSTLASISEKDFRRAFSRSPIKRAKYRGWLRNLCVAMGNSGDRSFIPWLEQATRHEDEIVREHAQWALERLTND